jgi:hypothetical protein
MNSVKATIIGGSNTVMAPGYLSALPKACERSGIKLDIVSNLSVGGTSSPCGLYRLKTENALEHSDLLLIEYALNDFWVYGDDRRALRQWTRVYEGIIRYALSTNPNIHILSMIFGPRNGPFLVTVPSINAGIYYITDWYSAAKVDLNREIIHRYGRDVLTHPDFYQDVGHYRRPISTGIIANIVAEALAEELGKPLVRRPVLPPPIDAGNFSTASTLTAAEISGMLEIAPTSYQNSRFAFDAVDISKKSIEFTIKGGKLLGLFYICVPEIAKLTLQKDDEIYLCSLMKSGVKSGPFKFLYSMLSCDFLYGSDLIVKDPTARYVLSDQQPNTSYKEWIPKDNVDHVQSNDGPGSLPLAGILYTGTIESFTAVPADPV